MDKFRVFAQKLGVWAIIGGLLWLNACNSEDKSAETNTSQEAKSANENSAYSDSLLAKLRKTLDSTQAVYTLDTIKGVSNGFLAFDTVRAIGKSKYDKCSYDLAVPLIKIEAGANNAEPVWRINELFQKFMKSNRQTPEELNNWAAIPNPVFSFAATFNVYRNDGNILGVSTSGYFISGCGYDWGKEYTFDLATGDTITTRSVFKDGFLPSLNKMLKNKLKIIEKRGDIQDISGYKGKEKKESTDFRLYLDSIVVVINHNEINHLSPLITIPFTIPEIKDLLRPEVFEKGWVKKD